MGQYAFLYELNAQDSMDFMAPYLSFQFNVSDDARVYADSVRVFYEKASSRLAQEDSPPPSGNMSGTTSKPS